MTLSSSDFPASTFLSAGATGICYHVCFICYSLFFFMILSLLLFVLLYVALANLELAMKIIWPQLMEILLPLPKSSGSKACASIPLSPFNSVVRQAGVIGLHSEIFE